MNTSLNDYKGNIYSQFGEDGIIIEITRRMGISSGTCIEFGAWDGVLLSNTANLWTNKDWEAVLIEPGKEKFKVLEKVAAPYKCLCLNDFVTPVGNTSLENILKREKISFENVKILSIDIDGNEYHIFNELKELHPPIVILEYNPTIPPDMSIIAKEDAFFGSSAKALNEIAEKKGYKLVAMTKTNCFFIDKTFAHFFTDLQTSFEELFDKSCLTYFITGYKGSYAFSQSPAFGLGLPLKRNLIEQGELYFIPKSRTRVRWNYTKDELKAAVKTVVGSEFIAKIRLWTTYLHWKLRGHPIPAHGIYKWMVLKRESKKYDTKVFIETGTAGGGTVLELEKYFDKLYTIELDPTLFHQGRAKVEKHSKITCLYGDSGIIMHKILDSLVVPATFWLDAHYSGEGTAKGMLDTPIINELRSIFSHKIKNHLIVIDDAREFNGTKDYPTIEELKKMIADEAPHYQFSQDNDLIIISPK